MSAQVARQLKIKTGSVRRLAVDVDAYAKEKEEHEAKLSALIEKGVAKNDIKRQRDFLDETDAVLQDVRLRLQTAYSDLEDLLLDVKQDECKSVESIAAYTGAMEILKSTVRLAPASRRLFESNEMPVIIRRTVAVYGSEMCGEGDSVWEMARQLGEKLAKAGCTVLNGGYGGISDASGLGASTAGGVVEGVICPSAFPQQGMHGNKYLTREVSTSSIEQRTASLAHQGDCYVVLPGGLSTLSSLIFTWNSQTVNQAASLKVRVIFVFKDPWENILQSLKVSMSLPESLLSCIRFVNSVEEVMDGLASLDP